MVHLEAWIDGSIYNFSVHESKTVMKYHVAWDAKTDLYTVNGVCIDADDLKTVAKVAAKVKRVALKSKDGYHYREQLRKMYPLFEVICPDPV